MRTYADRERDLSEGRYASDADDIEQHNPRTPEGAKAILASRGGKKAAQLALAAIWKAHKADTIGKRKALFREHIPAPFRVLRALETMGLIEETHDDTGLLECFRLTESGLRAALVADKAAEAARHG